MTDPEIAERTSAPNEAARGKAARMALIMLMLLNTMLVLDKIIFTIILEPIKEEFLLSDFQLGLLAGAVYAICLGVASLPFGYLADRTNRRNIAVGCLAFWSAMTALCGLAQSFTTLLMARIGVGIGESGGGPSSLSIISDYFEHNKRATAMAIFSLGTPLAGLINLAVNTQIVHFYGWRVALLIAAIPGAILALTMMIFMREPVRAASLSKSQTDQPSLAKTLRHVAQTPSLVMLLAGAMCAYVTLAGVSSWNFSFLIRVHDAKLNEIGPFLGVGIALAGIVGLYGSGRLADHFARRDERWRTRIMAITTLGSVLCGWGAFSTDSLVWAIIFTCGLAACSSLWLAPGYALSQSLVPARMRGMVGAIIFMLANVMGYGLGPPLVGLFSDLFAAANLEDPLRAALLATVSANLLSALLFLLAGARLVEGLEKAESQPKRD